MDFYWETKRDANEWARSVADRITDKTRLLAVYMVWKSRDLSDDKVWALSLILCDRATDAGLCVEELPTNEQ